MISATLIKLFSIQQILQFSWVMCQTHNPIFHVMTLHYNIYLLMLLQWASGIACFSEMCNKNPQECSSNCTIIKHQKEISIHSINTKEMTRDSRMQSYLVTAKCQFYLYLLSSLSHWSKLNVCLTSALTTRGCTFHVQIQADKGKTDWFKWKSVKKLYPTGDITLLEISCPFPSPLYKTGEL